MNLEELNNLSSAPETVEWAEMVDLALQGEPVGKHFSGKTNKGLDEIWTALRAEAHDLICTNSKKYAKERVAFEVTFKPSIAALAAFVTHHYGFPIAAASSLASLALVLPARMAKETWCKLAASKEIGTIEQSELKVLIKESHKSRKNS